MRYQLLFCKTHPMSAWYAPEQVARMAYAAYRLQSIGYEVSIWQHTSSGSRRLPLSSFEDFLFV